MQCDVCQTKEASVFLTQIVDGKMQKVNLCEACSKEKGVNDPTGFALADLLLGLGASQEIEKSFDEKKIFFSNKKSLIYDSWRFRRSLKGRNAINLSHLKTPAAFLKIREHDEKIKTLQSNLNKAIEAEEFELAASLRDQIRQVETDLAS